MHVISTIHKLGLLSSSFVTPVVVVMLRDALKQDHEAEKECKQHQRDDARVIRTLRRRVSASFKLALSWMLE